MSAAFFWESAVVSFLLSYLISRAILPYSRPSVSKGGRLMPPKIGGVILFLTLSTTFLIFFVSHHLKFHTFGGKEQKLLGVAVSAAFIFFLGFVDDRKKLPYWAKLPFQILIACLIPLVGFRLDFITSIGGTPLYLAPWFGSVVIVGWLVFMMNAVNLIDGLDGLASGVVAMASLTVFLVGWDANPLIASGALILAAALTGILPFNSYPARFFLGDAGSLLIGFLIGVYSVFFHVKTYLAIVLLIPLLVLFVPILNTVTVILTRLRRKRNPLKGDIFHLHYRLHRRGLSHPATVLFLYGVAGSLCCLVVARYYLLFRPRTILFLAGVLILYTILVQAFLWYLKKKREKHFVK